jgi:hypothetical protein
MQITNSATHRIIWVMVRDHRASFGLFHAKGCYLEVIILGKVFRVWVADERWR